MASPLIEKSDANWELANQLRKDGMFDAAANRFYYSLFQAVKAYAIKIKKMAESDSTGVHSQALRLVKDDKEDSDTFSLAMSLRKSADYLYYQTTASDLCHDFVYKADLLRTHYKNRAAS